MILVQDIIRGQYTKSEKIDFSIGEKIRKQEKLKIIANNCYNPRYYNLRGYYTKSGKIDLSIGWKIRKREKIDYHH